MQDDPTHAPEEADDAADLTHLAMLYATVPATLRVMLMVARHRGPELATQGSAQLAARRALAVLMPTMDEQRAGEAQRVATLAVRQHLQHVLNILNDPSLAPDDVEALILSARGRTIAAQREARAV
jgi:hypothetical protein